MVIDFSLDTAAEKIHNPKTREYFQEVLESYNIGNYRATIVMLYSIVVCDLVYKLQELKDIYNDKKATRLLNDLERRQKENPRSSDWEIELIKAVDERTLLIDVSTFENISILQKHRHLCAHPVMDENYELYKPNKETTRAHLRNMLESVFMRSPILSKDIFNELIVDLSEKKDYFPPKFENKNLEIYLKTKYLKHSPPKTIEYIFKNLGRDAKMCPL